MKADLAVDLTPHKTSANIRKLRTFLAEAEADADGTLKRLTSRRTRHRDRLADYAPAATGDPPAA